jgi:hypothetical protein
VERQLRFTVHPSEGMLEEYCFNRLPESALETLEEHLLACPSCQGTLEELDEYIQLMKAELAKSPVLPVTTPVTTPVTLADNTWARVRTAAIRPAMGIAAGMAMLGVMAILSLKVAPGRGTPAFDAPVRLAAFRGGDDTTVNHAPAGQPLELSIDVTDLPASNAYRVEVVNATGKRIWDATVSAANGRLSARVPNGLNPGVYWVRLYLAPGKLLREFGLRLA